MLRAVEAAAGVRLPAALSLQEFAVLYSHPLSNRRGLLGFDYGTTKCGLAWLPSLDEVPQALGVLHAPKTTGLTPSARIATANAAYAELLGRLLADKKPAGMVVGWPLDPLGRQSPQCGLVVDFLRTFTAKCPKAGVPIVLWDERHTTRIARAVLSGDGGAEGYGERHGTTSGWVTLQTRGGGKAAAASARAALVDDVAAEVLLDSFSGALARELQRRQPRSHGQ